MNAIEPPSAMCPLSIDYFIMTKVMIEYVWHQTPSSSFFSRSFGPKTVLPFIRWISCGRISRLKKKKYSFFCSLFSWNKNPSSVQRTLTGYPVGADSDWKNKDAKLMFRPIPDIQVFSIMRLFAEYPADPIWFCSQVLVSESFLTASSGHLVRMSNIMRKLGFWLKE